MVSTFCKFAWQVGALGLPTANSLVLESCAAEEQRMIAGSLRGPTEPANRWKYLAGYVPAGRPLGEGDIATNLVPRWGTTSEIFDLVVWASTPITRQARPESGRRWLCSECNLSSGGSLGGSRPGSLGGSGGVPPPNTQDAPHETIGWNDFDVRTGWRQWESPDTLYHCGVTFRNSPPAASTADQAEESQVRT